MAHPRVPTRLHVARGRWLSCVAVAGLTLTLGACKPGATTQSPDSGSGPTADSAANTTTPTGAPVVFASTGVPHAAAISLIALDPTGVAALTRDGAGGVRLWPALDGTREPLIVPIRDPRVMALAAHEDGWTLALIDGAGGVRLVGVDASGAMQSLASLPPTDPLLDVVVLPGGERVVAVGSDHVIRLLDRRGGELARLDVPGLRPASLRLAIAGQAGPRVVAVTAGEFDGKEGRFAVELLALELGAASITLTDQRQIIHIDSPATLDNPTVAPDGRSAVYLRRQRLGGATWTVHAIQLDDGREVSIDTQIALGQQPRVGLLPAGRVLLDDGSGIGRIADLRERKLELTALRSTPTVDHLNAVFAGGRRVVPASNWLAVHELATDDLVYLGYEQINVTDVGLSPSGASVAWALGDRVAVEGVGSNEVFEVPGTRATAQRFVEFLDEDRLVTLDWVGGAKILQWRDGEVVDEVDLGNQTQLAELARDGQGDAVMFVRTNLWQNPMVVALEDQSFGPRYLTHASGSLAGLLTPRDQPLTEWGGWTLDGAGRLRVFTLDSLGEGIDVTAAMTAGEVLSYGLPEQLAIGGEGQQYWIRTTSTRPTLHVERRGASAAEVELPSGFVVRLAPSPDGRRIAVVQQRDANQVLTMLDSETLQPLWAQPLPPVNGLAWSDASERIALPATFGGGVVFDGADGSVDASRCGLAFEVRRTPPQLLGFFAPLSVCEL